MSTTCSEITICGILIIHRVACKRINKYIKWPCWFGKSTCYKIRCNSTVGFINLNTFIPTVLLQQGLNWKFKILKLYLLLRITVTGAILS